MNKGGENTQKLDNRLLFALIISIVLLFSISSAFAGNNETTYDVIGTSDPLDDAVQISDVGDVQSSHLEEQTLGAGNNVINVVNIKDSYNATSKTWSEDGFDLKGATIKVYDSSNKLVSTHKTDSKGNVDLSKCRDTKYEVTNGVPKIDENNQIEWVLTNKKQYGYVFRNIDLANPFPNKYDKAVNVEIIYSFWSVRIRTLYFILKARL